VINDTYFMGRLQAYGGGTVIPAKGDLLVDNGVRLQSCYGGSEVGPITHMVPRVEDLADGDWCWARLWPGLSPRFERQEKPGIYELQFLVNSVSESQALSTNS
jgi:hypothetical protein